MNKTWVSVVIAALFEVGWVIGLKHATSVVEWIGTAIAIVVSFYLLIASSKVLPVGTVYAVFVGLGTAGTVIADIILFNAPIQPIKLALIAVLLVGVIGLKLVSKPSTQEVDAK